MEFAILDWIQAHLRCDFLDAVLPVIRWTSNHGEIWILLAVCLLLMKRTRWQGVTVSTALVMDLICCNMILKPLIGRSRPWLWAAEVERRCSCEWGRGADAENAAAGENRESAQKLVWVNNIYPYRDSMQEPLQKLDIGKNDGYRPLYLVE